MKAILLVSALLMSFEAICAEDTLRIYAYLSGPRKDSSTGIRTGDKIQLELFGSTANLPHTAPAMLISMRQKRPLFHADKTDYISTFRTNTLPSGVGLGFVFEAPKVDPQTKSVRFCLETHGETLYLVKVVCTDEIDQKYPLDIRPSAAKPLEPRTPPILKKSLPTIFETSE